MSRRIILAGGSGFLGQLLGRYLKTRGWEPIVLTRTPSSSAALKEVPWDAKTMGDWAPSLEGADAVINLAGRSVNCRYNPENRRAIIESRVDSTRALGAAIAQCKRPPQVWMNASTATIYRHTFGPPHDESSTDFAVTAKARDEFSVEVAQAWEKAFHESRTSHTRPVALRITLVFGTVDRGVFRILRRLARAGLGGKMANGRQFVSWIHDEDFCRAMEWILEHPELAGPINIAAPYPVTNAEMMRVLRQICGLPIGLPAAEWMLELGAFFLRTETELLLKSRRVVPGKLLANGFQFRFPKFEEAVQDLEQRVTGSLRQAVQL
jgi:uncharacterized protein (TIGR01777 family)